MVPLCKTTYEGTKIDGITCQCGLEQLIHEPAHIIGQRSSCIDLIFASQPNFVVESDVQSSLHQNFHHQIVFARFNLKVVFPAPYYVKYGILKKRMFSILEKLLRDFIPHETITCDDRDSPWINSSIGCLSKIKMRHISTLKEETTTVSTLKTFRIY